MFRARVSQANCMSETYESRGSREARVMFALNLHDVAEDRREGEEKSMAKGQVRSNREIRKPKKSAAEKSQGAASSSVTSTFAKSQPGGKKPSGNR